LIKILIVNFYYDLIMPNTGCVVLYNFTKERRVYEHGHILNIIIY